jgi:CheY-like chemotaxis protein
LFRRCSILVVDPLDETQEVLRSAFAGRGVDFLSAPDARRGLALARRHAPDLIVVDQECDADLSALPQRLAEEGGAPLIVLGTARRAAPRDCEFLPKPYHYAGLIGRIENALARLDRPRRAA